MASMARTADLVMAGARASSSPVRRYWSQVHPMKSSSTRSTPSAHDQRLIRHHLQFGDDAAGCLGDADQFRLGVGGLCLYCRPRK